MVRSICLTLVALFCCRTTVVLAERKPLLIASVRSVDGFFSDVNYLAQAAGAGALGQILTMTTQQYARGLDRQRPLAICLETDTTPSDSDYRWIIYLPTQDLRGFLNNAGSSLGDLEELPGNVIRAVGKHTWFLRQEGDWALMADSLESLQRPSLSAEKIVRGTDQKQDVSVRGFVNNLPQHLRDEALNQIQDRIRKELDKIKRNSANAQLRSMLVQEKWHQIRQLLMDADQFAVGLNVDSAARDVELSAYFTAKPNTVTYRRLSRFQLRPSVMSSLVSPQATGHWNAIGKLPEEDAQRFERLIASMQQSALRELRGARQFTDESTRQLTMYLAEALLDTCRQSIQQGFFDGAGMVLVDNGVAAVMAIHVADTKRIQDAIASLASRNSAGGMSWQVAMNAAQSSGMQMHTIRLETPTDQNMRRLVGPFVQLTVGLARDRLYVAWGESGVQLISRAIEATGQPPRQSLPMDSQVSLMPILRYYSSRVGDKNTAALVQFLTQKGASDKVSFRASPIRDGVQFEAKLDEAALRLIGHVALMPHRSSKRKITKSGPSAKSARAEK